MDQRQALVDGLVQGLLLHGQITTTFTWAKQAQRAAEHLVTLGKEGSVHSRRLAFRTLQDRTLVKRLFAEIAPRYTDVSGGYTRIVRLAKPRRGDGAQMALLGLSRLPEITPQPKAPARAETSKPSSAPESKTPAQTPEGEKPKGFFEGLRTLWPKKK
jgi:large subunit ribosomal protein L17